MTLRNDGIVQTRAGRLPEAEALFREALHLTPDDPEIHRHLGLTLWAQGRTAAAGEHLERAAALRPGDDEAERLLAQFRADPGRAPKLR
jgi:Flp pilus assembly protein TadD